LSGQLWISSCFKRKFLLTSGMQVKHIVTSLSRYQVGACKTNVVAELSVLAYCRVEVCNDLAANEVHQALRPAA